MARKTMPERSPLNPKVLIMGGVLGFALATGQIFYSSYNKHKASAEVAKRLRPTAASIGQRVLSAYMRGNPMIKLVYVPASNLRPGYQSLRLRTSDNDGGLHRVIVNMGDSDKQFEKPVTFYVKAEHFTNCQAEKELPCDLKIPEEKIVLSSSYPPDNEGGWTGQYEARAGTDPFGVSVSADPADVVSTTDVRRSARRAEDIRRRAELLVGSALSATNLK